MITGESWIVERGEYAVLIALALGGYLAAAAILWQWKSRGIQSNAIKLVIALIATVGVLSIALSPFTLSIGIASALLAWGISAANRPGKETAAIHIGVMVLIGAAVALRPDDIEIWVDYWQREPVIAAQIGVFIAAYALVTVPAAELIGHGIKTLGLGPGKEEPQDANEEAGIGRGRVIGIMERAILLTLGLLGQWQAIGLVVAAKSIARYKNLDEQRFAEYYLIGTLASLLTALLIGIGAQIIT